MPMVAVRYDLRRPSFAASHPDLYRTALDQCVWADEVGLDTVVLSEHHGTDDGYLPSPLVLAAAVAGRTERIGITIAALLVPLHDPLGMAEDLAVLDLASGGRVSVVAGLGYRPEEFEAFGVDRSHRGRILEDHVEVMQRAWTGEPFEHRGTTVRVSPRPLTPGGPMLMVGGSTEAAARRAARLRCGFFPAIDDPKLLEIYNEENDRLGHPTGIASLPAGPNFVYVSDDPDRDWERIGPHALHDAMTYRSWQTPGQRSTVESTATTVDELRDEGVYRVVTPDECVELAGSLGDFGTLALHPLMGGLDPELSWAGLRRFADEVLPRLDRP